MKFRLAQYLFLGLLLLTTSCIRHWEWPEQHIREMVDPIGFAANSTDLDTVMHQLDQNWKQEENQILTEIKDFIPPKALIIPHDDYAYASYLYPPAFEYLEAETLVLVGVFHKAAKFGVENQLVFGNFTHWRGPLMLTEISDLRDSILQNLDTADYIVSDSMMQTEHSLEAFIPFLQYYRPGTKIIPLLVPAMSFDRMKELSENLTNAIKSAAKNQNIILGKDIAILISSDAVHYGDEGWGGKNLAPYGSDSAGNAKAFAHEQIIIKQSLSGAMDESKIKKFINFTTEQSDFHKYKWTWCGRYSIPFGLLSAMQLETNSKQLQGKLAAYANSIDHPKLDLKGTKMGTTAPANTHHWVGYALMFYY